jgi:hypothetical protein
MKVLMIYCNEFSYIPKIKTLEGYEEHNEGKTFNNALVGFIQVEEKDAENLKSVEDKLLKNLKWAAKKNNTNKVILHSFAHLSDSKASPEVSKQIFDKVEKRLLNANYECEQTPFGYFLDIKVDAPGYSLARIFKDL